MSRKKAARSEPVARRQPKERLQTCVLEELWSIWRADPRVPSIESRRSWAVSRNANPRLVDGWFLRRKTCAKKAGQPMPDGSYDLPLDLPIVPKREQSPTPVGPKLDAPDSPSDDTLVLVYPPDSDDLNDIEASSDTIFDGDTAEELKRTETPAYKEVPQQSRPEPHHSQLNLSPSDLYAPEDRCDEDTLLFENPSFPVCNQGRGKQSDFTCILCSTKSAQDSETQSDSDAASDPREALPIPCPRLDFFPDTLSELSAIPFLFRTPRAVRPDNTVERQSVDDWTIVEDELGRLVNDGKLDFSFLDVPHLASMELLD